MVAGHRLILRRIPVALVTNYIPPYRVPLYRLLAERLGVEVFLFGGEPHYVPASLRDLDSQIRQAPFPAHRLARQRDAYALGRSHDAVIATITGRVALPAAYVGARIAQRPFVLWASLWRHPRTPVHVASFPLMWRIYRRADAIVTYGDHVSRYLARYRGAEESVFAAPQAVEPDLFGCGVTQDEVGRWRREHDLGEGPLVLYVGRLERDKGIDVLLDAWERFERPGDARLCLVGDGPLAESLRTRTPEAVRLAGRMPRGELPVAYEAADVVVVPSIPTRRFLEPWGLVVNEAMLRGRPVIASAAVGAAAGGLVRDGETGLVVPPADAGALARAFGRLLRDGALRARLGRAGREEVSGYTYERAAEAFRRALAAAGAG